MRKQKYNKIGEYVRLAVVLYSEKEPRGFQKRIADALKVEKTYVSDFFNAKRMISEDLRAELAKYLGFEYGDIIKVGKRIASKSVTFYSGFGSQIYGEGFPQKKREKEKIKIADLAFLLGISEAEYIFKEKEKLGFTNRELSKLADYMSLTEAGREEYLMQVWREDIQDLELKPDKKQSKDKKSKEKVEILENIKVKDERAIKRMMAEHAEIIIRADEIFNDLRKEENRIEEI